MAIDVYWACFEKEWLRCDPPVNMKKNLFSQEYIQATGIHMCPATRDFITNYYGLKSIYDYEFEIIGDKISSQNYDQKFYNEHIYVRNFDHRVISFMHRYIFVTENESLLTTICHPFLEDNNVTKRCIVTSGQFDIGKWFRVIEFAFKLRNGYNNFKIEEGEIYTYIKFHTNEDINLIQFKCTEFFDREYLSDIEFSKSNQNKKKYRNLKYRYDMFSTKKLMMQEIKKNVLT